MEVKGFVDALNNKLGIDAFYGVPDSLLRALCDELLERYGLGESFVVAADEGGATALAAGHFLATGKPAVVYMQNSGIGNAVNPICSLLNEQVYAIPTLFVVGWRGEPGVHDEPQHVFQGECSEQLLEIVGLSVDIIDGDTDVATLESMLEGVAARFAEGKSSALLVRKGALTRAEKHAYKGAGGMLREQALEAIVDALPENAAVVGTTGKLSRELFEIRERRGQGHERDFLTVGSMGHSSMIGLGVALAQPERPVFVLDGDGAAIMHTGALAIVGECKPCNFVHVVVNNEAHESVGGMPTASPTVDWCGIAAACGYVHAASVATADELSDAIAAAMAVDGPAFIEVKTDIGARADLGRPTTTAYDNGRNFQKYLMD